MTTRKKEPKGVTRHRIQNEREKSIKIMTSREVQVVFKKKKKNSAAGGSRFLYHPSGFSLSLLHFLFPSFLLS